MRERAESESINARSQGVSGGGHRTRGLAHLSRLRQRLVRRRVAQAARKRKEQLENHAGRRAGGGGGGCGRRRLLLLGLALAALVLLGLGRAEQQARRHARKQRKQRRVHGLSAAARAAPQLIKQAWPQHLAQVDQRLERGRRRGRGGGRVLRARASASASASASARVTLSARRGLGQCGKVGVAVTSLDPEDGGKGLGEREHGAERGRLRLRRSLAGKREHGGGERGWRKQREHADRGRNCSGRGHR